MVSRAWGRWPGVLASGAVLVAVTATVIAVRAGGPDSSEPSSVESQFGTSASAPTTTTESRAVAASCSLVTAATLAAHVPGAVCLAAPESTRQLGAVALTVVNWQGTGAHLEVRRTVDPVAPLTSYTNSRTAAAAVFPSFHDTVDEHELVEVGDQGVVISGRSGSSAATFTAHVDAVSGPLVVDVLAAGYHDAATAEAAAIAAARDALASPQ
ncbi:hypothetical protein OG225_43335 (plasmid) [Nocardia sp. NBC_01377]|uniref:hypothetical protein n=1 Tax=Nocardia sp. NBC_01377 TaxID=2903595 RepID=UPI002F90DEA0